MAIGIKQRNLLDVPNNERGAVWHGLPHLMKVHGVQVVLDQAVAGNRLLRDNWLVVKYWDSNARFPTTSIKGKDAVEMLNAVAHADHGIFQWLLNRYDQI